MALNSLAAGGQCLIKDREEACKDEVRTGGAVSDVAELDEGYSRGKIPC
jgi:hypothetical protein